MFAGHFPDMPIAPGAWLLGRAMEVLEESAGEGLAWGELESGKFHRAATPGCTLDVTLDGWHTSSDPASDVTKVAIAENHRSALLTISQQGTAVASARFRFVVRRAGSA